MVESSCQSTEHQKCWVPPPVTQSITILVNYRKFLHFIESWKGNFLLLLFISVRGCLRDCSFLHLTFDLFLSPAIDALSRWNWVNVYLTFIKRTYTKFPISSIPVKVVSLIWKSMCYNKLWNWDSVSVNLHQDLKSKSGEQHNVKPLIVYKKIKHYIMEVKQETGKLINITIY